MSTTLDNIAELLKENSIKLDNLKIDIGKLDKRLENMETSHAEFKNEANIRMSNIEKRLLEQEINDKKRNIILHKIEENEKSQEELTAAIVEFLASKVDSSIDIKDIDFIYRLGKKTQTPRPVLVGFRSLYIKEKVKKAKSKFLEDSIGISDDFPKIVKDNRKIIAPIVNSLYGKGFKVYMKQDKIIVNGEQWTFERAKKVAEEQPSITNKRDATTISPLEPQDTKRSTPALKTRPVSTQNASKGTLNLTKRIQDYMLQKPFTSINDNQDSEA